ncbi:MAG: hypothetical protein Q8R26_03410 [bacterium]|nr:hypothetical protein [bacterium]
MQYQHFSVEEREKIQQVRRDFQSIYLLAEVQKWEEKIIATPKICPLVVGYAVGDIYLIANFDTTPLEYYIKAEFAVSSKTD